MISFVQANGAVPVTGSGTVTVQPPYYSQAAFGEARVSTPTTLLNLVNRYGIDTRIVATSATLSASVSASTSASSIVVAVSASASAVAELSTRNYYRYQAGRGHRWIASIINSDTGSAGQNRSWGYFDDNNGVFFKLTGTTLGVCQRSNTSGAPVDTFVSQSLWNIDKMNGTGPSGMTLDITKGNIYEGSFQWLGVGAVTFFIDGFPVHQISNQNQLALPYMATANLPFRVRCNNAAGSSSGSLTLVCANVTSENGENPPHWAFGAENSSGFATSGTTEVPLLSIQLTGTYNGVDNRAKLHPQAASFLVSNANGAIFRIRTNMSLSAPTWQSVDPQSVAMFDTSSQSGSGGQLVAGAIFINGPASIPFQDITTIWPEGAEGVRRLVRDPYTGVSDSVTITIQRMGAGNASSSVSLTWGEEL